MRREKKRKPKKTSNLDWNPSIVFHAKNHLDILFKLTNGKLGLKHGGVFENFHGTIKNEKLDQGGGANPALVVVRKHVFNNTVADLFRQLFDYATEAEAKRTQSSLQRKWPCNLIKF